MFCICKVVKSCHGLTKDNISATSGTVIDLFGNNKFLVTILPLSGSRYHWVSAKAIYSAAR